MSFDKSKVFQSNYLKAEDIPATGIDVTIESTWEEEVDYNNGKGPQTTAQMKFQEFPKPMGLNVTNTESIEQLLGKDNSKWDGGVIRLYRTTTRNQSGAVVPCIRIQPPLGKPAPAAAAAPVDPVKAAWSEFYLTLDQTQKANVTAMLGGSPSQWMTKTGKDINACIMFLKSAFNIGAEPVAKKPEDDIPF